MTSKFVCCQTSNNCAVTKVIASMGNRSRAVFCANSMRCDSRVRSNQSLSCVAANTVKPYVPRVSVDLLNFLTSKCDTDKFRTYPMSSVSEKCKAAIKIAATHADAIVVLVECDERRYDEIKLPRRNDFAVDGLPKTKIIS